MSNNKFNQLYFKWKKIKEVKRKDELPDKDYKSELAKEFKTSLESGVMISRREFDMYTVQDNDYEWDIPKHVIRLKLTNGKLQLQIDGGEYCDID